MWVNAKLVLVALVNFVATLVNLGELYPVSVAASTGKVARWQNLIPSFPWIVPGWRVWGCNPRKGRDQILRRSVAEPLPFKPGGPNAYNLKIWL